MITDLDDSIRQLLIDEGGIPSSDVDISFEIPNGQWSAAISRPTINCYLFDIREDVERKESGWLYADKSSGKGSKRLTPLCFSVTYLITAWTRSVDDEHRLLWHVLRTLTRFPHLPGDILRGELLEPVQMGLPIITAVAQPKSVLESPGEFWSAIQNQLKPSLSYTLSLPMERDALALPPPVISTTLIAGDLGRGRQELRSTIGGSVRDKQGRPIPGATVEIEGIGRRVRADAQGRFVFSGLDAGRYTLIARAEHATQHMQVEIPVTSYDLTLDHESSAA